MRVLNAVVDFLGRSCWSRRPAGEAGLHGAGRECAVCGVCVDEGTECCC